MFSISLNLLFFPGMILHEFSHFVACAFLGVKVSRLKLFGVKEAFVEHAKPNAWQSVAITLAPFFLCNLLSFLLFNYANELVGAQNILSILAYWLALSLALFSFPSKQDALNAFNSFIDFYKEKLFGKDSLLEKLIWLAAFPFLFVPLVLVLGTMLAFDYSVSLRFIWAVAIFVFSFEPQLLQSIVSSISQQLMRAIFVFF